MPQTPVHYPPTTVCQPTNSLISDVELPGGPPPRRPPLEYPAPLQPAYNIFSNNEIHVDDNRSGHTKAHTIPPPPKKHKLKLKLNQHTKLRRTHPHDRYYCWGSGRSLLGSSCSSRVADINPAHPLPPALGPTTHSPTDTVCCFPPPLLTKTLHTTLHSLPPHTHTVTQSKLCSLTQQHILVGW